MHLELVDTVENVARAKAELIEALPPGGVAVVPAGETLLEPYLEREGLVVERVDPDLPLPFTPSFAARHQLENARTATVVAGSWASRFRTRLPSSSRSSARKSARSRAAGCC